tara:strand:+ start:293 stop:526 length:234 start_codon:yes stop_codon:yes gene_type:complete
MKVSYLQKNSDGIEERIIHSTHDTREEAHTAAVTLADSLVGNDNILQVERGYASNETTFIPRVSYNIPPTDEQRNPS